MAQGCEGAEWNRTSHVLAWIQNWSGFSEKSVGPKELNPTIPVAEAPTIDAVDLALMFCGQAAVKYFAELDAANGKNGN